MAVATAMRLLRFLAMVGLSLMLTGCGATGGTSKPLGSPACLPYRNPLAVGGIPGWSLRLIGLQPVYPGGRVALHSQGIPSASPGGWASARTVRFYLMADLKNVSWWDQSRSAAACIARHGSLWGQVAVHDGHFAWTGTVPRRVTEGHLWYVVAVADNGYYAVLNLADGTSSDVSMDRLAKPYQLTVWPGSGLPVRSVSDGAPNSLDPGEPFRLHGVGLSPSGSFLVRLDIRAPKFDSDANLGTVRAKAGHLDDTVDLPRVLNVEGVGRRTLSPRWSYELSLRSTNGRMVYYSLPVTVR